MVCPAKVTWKKQRQSVSENVRVKVSSIGPVFIQAVMRSQQREEARVSVCLVAGDTGPSLYKAPRLSHLTRGKKSRARTHTSGMNCWSGEHRLVAQWKRLCSNLSREPADIVDWNLCENDLGFSAPVIRLP